MATQAQIDANRLNAQMSTGPATDDGKAKTRFNAVKHGAYAIESEITGEDAEKFAARERRYFEYYEPKDPAELFHLKTMVASENEIDRCVLLEASALKALITQQPEDSQNPIGDAVVHDSAGANALEKLARRRETAHRRWVRSEKLLMVALNNRWAAEEAETQEIKVAKPAAAPAPRPVKVPPQPSASPDPQPSPQNATRPAAQTPGPPR